MQEYAKLKVFLKIIILMHFLKMEMSVSGFV